MFSAFLITGILYGSENRVLLFLLTNAASAGLVAAVLFILRIKRRQINFKEKKRLFTIIISTIYMAVMIADYIHGRTMDVLRDLLIAFLLIGTGCIYDKQ